MSRDAKHYYITTPIYYVNAPAHLGHMYTSVAADIMARFQRLLGADVHFLTGTDEHGQKIARAAEARGVGPQTFVDEISQTYRDVHATLNISNTDFIRTTDPRHIKGAQIFWQAARASGDIYKKKYEGLYCVACEQFYIAKDIPDSLCPIHGKPVELLQEENYFFRLSKYNDALKQYFDTHPNFVFPENRWREMRTILDEGLDDVSISRSRAQLSWGIPVPDDDEQVMYVWFDALTNYITAIGYGEDEKMFECWWPANAHVMGKEINRFHSLLWPAMLLSGGVQLPGQIVVHGWLTVNGQKMSKTTGNIVDPSAVVAQYGLDAFRYFLFREMPFGGDGDFSFAKLEQRYRSDLGNDLGNLVMRTVAMTHKYCDGRVPGATVGDNTELWGRYRAHLLAWELQDALALVWEYIRGMNQLIDHDKPWVAAKEGRDADVRVTLYTLLEGLRQVAIAISPCMPDTSKKILEQLGFEYFDPKFDTMEEWGLLKEGAIVTVAEPLFPQLTA